MDNMAHTLVGAALGRAVAGDRVPGAALLGAVAGNAPDWAELLVTPAGAAPLPWAGAGATYLVYHRGITHSLVGAALEVVALTLLTAAVTLWWARRGGKPAPAVQAIATCVAAAVVSHLYLDWQGSYGLRPFLPWSGRWYYADWVAIVDPLFWILPLIGLAWGARRHWAPALGYLIALLGVGALVAVVGRRLVVPWAQLVVLALIAVCFVGWLRHWFGVAARRRAAAYALLVLALYAGASAVASLPAKAAARSAAVRRFGPDAEWAALTVLGRPFRWEPMWASADTVAGRGWAVPRHLTHPAVGRALATADGRASAGFARFLAAEVDSSGAGTTVYLRDARYEHTARRGWGVVAVRLEAP